MKNNNSRPLCINWILNFSKIGSLEAHIKLNLEVSISNFLTKLKKSSCGNDISAWSIISAWSLRHFTSFYLGLEFRLRVSVVHSFNDSSQSSLWLCVEQTKWYKIIFFFWKLDWFVSASLRIDGLLRELF